MNEKVPTPLNTVVTVPEACRMWRKGRNAVLYAIDTGLEARKSGKTWLISVRSLTQRWGKPCEPFRYNR